MIKEKRESSSGGPWRRRRSGARSPAALQRLAVGGITAHLAAILRFSAATRLPRGDVDCQKLCERSKADERVVERVVRASGTCLDEAASLRDSARASPLAKSARQHVATWSQAAALRRGRRAAGLWACDRDASSPTKLCNYSIDPRRRATARARPSQVFAHTPNARQRALLGLAHHQGFRKWRSPALGFSGSAALPGGGSPRDLAISAAWPLGLETSK